MREAAIATLFEGEMQELEDVIAASEFRLKKTASANESSITGERMPSHSLRKAQKNGELR